MQTLDHALKRLLKLAPKVKLDHTDIQEVIDTGSFNGVVSRYKLGKAKVPKVEALAVVPADDPTVTGTIEEIKDEIDQEEELADHIVECDDGSCECKSVFDE